MLTTEQIAGMEHELSLDERRAFLKLPLDERRRRLAEQADKLAGQYEQPAERSERMIWQGGDIVEC